MSLDSIFTPRGTNAAKRQQKQFNQAANMNLDIMNAANPYILQGINTLGQNINTIAKGEPARNAALLSSASRLGNMARTYTPEGMAARVENSATDRGMMNLRAILASNPNLSEAARTGLLYDAINQGTQAGNSAYIQASSPEYQAKMAADVSQALSQNASALSNSPTMQSIMALYNMFAGAGNAVNGQPQVQVQPGFGEVLGQAFGAWAQSGFKGI